MKPFPAEDRELYPDMFRIPDGIFEVRMAKPLGIVFEEMEAGGGGVYVAGITIGLMQVMVGGLWGEYASFLGGGYTTILPYIVMLVVLMIRPTGVFGQAAVRRV